MHWLAKSKSLCNPKNLSFDINKNLLFHFNFKLTVDKPFELGVDKFFELTVNKAFELTVDKPAHIGPAVDCDVSIGSLVGANKLEPPDDGKFPAAGPFDHAANVAFVGGSSLESPEISVALGGSFAFE